MDGHKRRSEDEDPTLFRKEVGFFVNPASRRA